MNPFYLRKIVEQDEKNLSRRLQVSQGQDFCSNDYLGFAKDPILKKQILSAIENVDTGSTGSRLLRGNSSWICQLEEELASFSGSEETLFFPSGYQANLGLLSAILDKDTLVFSDQTNHASIIDGIRLSGAEKQIFNHNDVSHLKELLQNTSSKQRKVIVIESIYSMRGDFAPLKEIFELGLQFGAELVVDETHATGVYQAGMCKTLGIASQVLATVHSGGKALGVGGAWIATSSMVKDFVINFSRPFIYSTAPTPLLSEALRMSVQHWYQVGEARAFTAKEKARDLRKDLSLFMADSALSGEGLILFLNLHESALAIEWSERLREKALDVRPIRYPTVPEGEAGLRISIHADQPPGEIKALTHFLKRLVLEC